MTDKARQTQDSIRVGEMAVGENGEELRTLLGSCIGLSLYDRRHRVGGLAHILLPESRGQTDTPGKYVDTAVPQLIEKMQTLAGEKVRPVAKLVGGSNMFPETSSVEIGQQNIEACEELLRKLEITVLARDCGGKKSRRMSLDTATGKVTIQVANEDPVEL